LIRTLLERVPKKKKYLGISFGKKQTPHVKKSPQNKKEDYDGESDDTASDRSISDGGSTQPNTPAQVEPPKILTTAPNGDKRFTNLKLGIMKGLNYLKKKVRWY
jgi:hypothetical protein